MKLIIPSVWCSATRNSCCVKQIPGLSLQDDLKTIEKHARNCKTILDDLLKFARSTPTKKSSVDINECLGEVISLLAHQFELEKISLQTVLEPGLPRLVADGEKSEAGLHESVDERQTVHR